MSAIFYYFVPQPFWWWCLSGLKISWVSPILARHWSMVSHVPISYIKLGAWRWVLTQPFILCNPWTQLIPVTYNAIVFILVFITVAYQVFENTMCTLRPYQDFGYTLCVFFMSYPFGNWGRVIIIMLRTAHETSTL